ncbi:MAG: protease SohB [Porticoccaceae bacterium]
MEFLSEYGMFLARVVTFVVAVIVILSAVVGLAQKVKGQEKGHFEIHHFNEKILDMQHALDRALTLPGGHKGLEKSYRKEQKQRDALAKKTAKKKHKDGTQDGAENSIAAKENVRKRVFVLDFHGDLRASAVTRLREEVTAVLSRATGEDEIVVRLESPGGVVHGYGLAASQLDRIKKQQVPLTVCVDKVAASGGYMMACVADKILAAPFAVLGSIGVVAQIPNVHRLLKKHDVDVELITAGKYKRTLTMLGENTDEGREKFQSDIEDTHELFKEFVSSHRPALDMEAIATGEIWFGTRALTQNLVDELLTSDEYLVAQVDSADIYEIAYVKKKSLQQKVGMVAEESMDRVLGRWMDRAKDPQLPI